MYQAALAIFSPDRMKFLEILESLDAVWHGEDQGKQHDLEDQSINSDEACSLPKLRCGDLKCQRSENAK